MLLVILGVGVLLTVGAYFYAQKSNSLLAQKIYPYTTKLSPLADAIIPFTQSIELPEQAIPEVTMLTQRGKELTEHVGTVLGESVAEAPAEQQPLHKRAIEYGQYLYCKGIVEEYENNHDTSKP